MPEKRQRRARCRTDAEILTIIRKMAADRGAYPRLINDRLYSLVDRQRARELLLQMEAEGALLRFERKAAKGGPGCWRMFLDAARGAMFSDGRLLDEPKQPRKAAAAPTFVMGRMPTQVLAAGQPVIGADKTPVQGPSCRDNRFTVRELPPGYRSQISAAECRPWAVAAVQGRAAA